eukprot:scaffold14954_cov122-Isochrysis_galbana.AAC.6
MEYPPADARAAADQHSAGTGAQSHLCRALTGSGRLDSLRARLRVQIVLLRRHDELSGLHRSFNRVSGIL